MYIKHYQTCKSTQELFLKEKLYNCFPAILSSDHLTDAKGRRDRKWDVYKGALACTFSLTKHEIVTLSALEVAVLIREFISKEFNIDLNLKWPNDLYDKELNKCGGILINSTKENLIVGVGLNLAQGSDYGSVFGHKSPVGCEELALKLYRFIIANRLSSNKIISLWSNYCFHIQTKVSMDEDDKQSIGVFKGIGKFGQAIVQVESEDKEFYSATLRPLP